MKNYIFVVAVLILLLGAANACLATNVEYTLDWDKNVILNNAAPYEIAEVEDMSRKAMTKSLSAYTTKELMTLPENKKIAYKIVFPKNVKTSQIKATVYKIILDITSKDKEIDEIILNFYSDKELVRGGGSDIGNAVWAPNGELGNVIPHIATSNSRLGYKITYSIKGNLEDYLKQRSKEEAIFGYSEKQRRTIYKEIVAAEDKANEEAERKYPMNAIDPRFSMNNIEKNIELSNTLSREFTLQVLRKYKLTEEQKYAICTEALKEGWALD